MPEFAPLVPLVPFVPAVPFVVFAPDVPDDCPFELIVSYGRLLTVVPLPPMVVKEDVIRVRLPLLCVFRSMKKGGVSCRSSAS